MNGLNVNEVLVIKNKKRIINYVINFIEKWLTDKYGISRRQYRKKNVIFEIFIVKTRLHNILVRVSNILLVTFLFSLFKLKTIKSSYKTIN